MLNKDLITDMIIKTGIFMNKNGQDITATQNLAKAINALFEDNALDAIFVNKEENINIPDVAVIPLYHQDFSTWVLNPNDPETCPFGYTIEIKSSCFRTLSPEELAAVILHDVMQTAQSDTAKIRFMKAYNHAISAHNPEAILNVFTDISTSEVTYMLFMQICCRPFRVPILQADATGTDDVLKAVGLSDAYNSYLRKYNSGWISNSDELKSIDKAINQEIEADFRDAQTIINACLDNDIRHYYNMVRTGVPLVTLDHVMGTSKTMNSLGFISRKRAVKRHFSNVPAPTETGTTIAESYMNPRTEIELRFKVDQIISEMRYAESEAEREVILFKIKNLTLKMIKTKQDIEKKMSRDSSNKTYKSQMDSVMNFIDELNMLREKCLKMELKQKVWRIYSKVDLPEGYQF